MKNPPHNPDSRSDNSAEFRFYEELNDFLRPEQRKQTLTYRFNGNPGIKDPIEVFGVPHTEVDLIVVNGESVGFGYRLKDADRIAVYPVFEGFDISPIVRLREAPLRHTAFVVDVNLGKLARLLRLFGFDTLFANSFDDREIAAISVEQQRIILTRDRLLGSGGQAFAATRRGDPALRFGAPAQAVLPLHGVQRFDRAGRKTGGAGFIGA
jgi:hypothetical protein